MEKILLRKKTVIDSGFFIKKWYCSKRIANHPKNSTFGLEVGWRLDADVDCTPKCPDPTPQGYYLCEAGNCIFIPV